MLLIYNYVDKDRISGKADFKIRSYSPYFTNFKPEEIDDVLNLAK